MINSYHMALINDNDFGLEGNTHVQIAIVQLDAKSMIAIDPCMSTGLSCSTETFPMPTKCSVSGNMPAAYKAPPPINFGKKPLRDAEIGVYVIAGLLAATVAFIVGRPFFFPASVVEGETTVNTKDIEVPDVKSAMPDPMPSHSFSTMPMAPISTFGYSAEAQPYQQAYQQIQMGSTSGFQNQYAPPRY